MVNALSTHAEEAYADIKDEKGKEICKKIFFKMPKYLLSLLFLCLTSTMWSQSQQEKLEQRKAQIQKEIRETLAIQKENPFTNHLEIETYTWGVLPPAFQVPMAESISREIKTITDLLG